MIFRGWRSGWVPGGSVLPKCRRLPGASCSRGFSVASLRAPGPGRPPWPGRRVCGPAAAALRFRPESARGPNAHVACGAASALGGLSRTEATLLLPPRRRLPCQGEHRPTWHSGTGNQLNTCGHFPERNPIWGLPTKPRPRGHPQAQVNPNTFIVARILSWPGGGRGTGLSRKSQELLSRCFGSAEQTSVSPDERPHPSAAIRSPTAPVPGNSLQSGGGDWGVTKSGTR